MASSDHRRAHSRRTLRAGEQVCFGCSDVCLRRVSKRAIKIGFSSRCGRAPVVSVHTLTCTQGARLHWPISESSPAHHRMFCPTSPPLGSCLDPNFKAWPAFLPASSPSTSPQEPQALLSLRNPLFVVSLPYLCPCSAAPSFPALLLPSLQSLPFLGSLLEVCEKGLKVLWLQSREHVSPCLEQSGRAQGRW